MTGFTKSASAALEVRALTRHAHMAVLSMSV
jgi:hypothetical protein